MYLRTEKKFTYILERKEIYLYLSVEHDFIIFMHGKYLNIIMSQNDLIIFTNGKTFISIYERTETYMYLYTQNIFDYINT